MCRVMTIAVVLGAGLLLSFASGTVQAMDQAAEEAAIRKAVDAYVAAYNAGDAKALAQLWSPQAVYTDRLSGEQVVGRAEIEKQFTDIFAETQGAKLEASTSAIQFLSPNVAVESGIARLTVPEQEPEQSDYTAVYVKQGDAWLLDRVTEEDVPSVPTQYEHLKDLEWMIGTWIDEDEYSRIETTCEWTRNKTFITRAFVLSVADRVDMAGIQIVGWDPVAKKIRSWVFDSSGGFAEGTWTKKDNAWYVQSTGTLPDGRRSSSVNIMTLVDNDTFTWQSVNREVDGEILPNVDEVAVVRQSDTQSVERPVTDQVPATDASQPAADAEAPEKAETPPSSAAPGQNPQ